MSRHIYEILSNLIAARPLVSEAGIQIVLNIWR